MRLLLIYFFLFSFNLFGMEKEGIVSAVSNETFERDGYVLPQLNFSIGYSSSPGREPICTENALIEQLMKLALTSANGPSRYARCGIIHMILKGLLTQAEQQGNRTKAAIFDYLFQLLNTTALESHD